jgi:glycosyltransferase involved in cell wall biosynthesis
MNDFALKVFRRIDKKLGNHVEFLSCNSYEIQARILKSWGRQSDVIWPPVSIPPETSERDSEIVPNFPFKVGEYLLSAGRFVDYKNHEFSLQVAESAQMPIVFMGGGTPSRNLTKAISSSSVEVLVLKDVTNFEWNAIMKNARCLLFPVHEDFGMTPVESIALGTPVIALGKGGALDYIQEGVNGFCIDALDINKWSNVVKKSEFDTFDKKKMLDSVQNFSVEAFRKKFSFWVLNCVKTYSGPRNDL